MRKMPVCKRKKMRRRYKKGKLPDWVRVSVNERKRAVTVRMEIEGFLRRAKADKYMTFVIRPKAMAKKGPGPYDYMLEVRIGNIVLPGPLNVFFPDEKLHGREFFERAKKMLGDARALKEKP